MNHCGSRNISEFKIKTFPDKYIGLNSTDGNKIVIVDIL